jgi:excinuclease ABC subunit C
MTTPEHLIPILEGIPVKPGCYLMKDKAGEVIYIGKAVQLRNRVRSYFHESASHSRKTEEMIGKVVDIEWIVVGSELEALILEMNLIKRYKPKYNVRLKDDKRYPYIKVHWSDPFPKVTVTRQHRDDSSRYYGPYTNVWAVHQTLDILRKIFPYLTCDRTITGADTRACLYYDIKLCTAPCIGKVDQEQYRAMIEDLSRFLLGNTDPVVERLKVEMDRASESLEYEQAGAIRDQILAIEQVVEQQKVVSQDRMDSDVIAFARDEHDACVQIFFIRHGKLIGREYFILDGAHEAGDDELVEAFVKQFYTEATNIPERVLLPTEIEEAKIIETWLRDRRDGRKVQIRVPRRGTKRQLLQLAAENAAETLASLRAKWEVDRSKHVQALSELQKELELREPPNRIECYDISNLQGTEAAGSMVVFEQGAPSKKLYRHFRIKSVQGQDDFASMEEVLDRRFRRWEIAKEQASKPGGKLDKGFGILPDLLIVDGGKGQLSRAAEVLRRYNLGEEILVFGLAKGREEIYPVDHPDPIILPRRSQGLYLVQRIRDEAHRFALRQHQRQRRRSSLKSKLDAIQGIGPARKKALMKAFGDLKGVKNASIEDIAALPGISLELAGRVKESL